MAAENDAAKAAGEALEQALLKATRVVELELARIVKAGEDDLDRLARRIAETLARMAIDGAMDVAVGGRRTDDAGGGADGKGSVNQIAAAIARAARRGTRFS